MNDSRINIPLLRKALEYIDAYPEKHDQLAWAKKTDCETTMCLAGIVTILAGRNLMWHPIIEWMQDNVAACDTVATHTTNYHPIPDVAQLELNLTEGQAIQLFYECKTANQLWAYAEEITNGEIKRAP